MKSHKDLNVWNRSIELVITIYKVTKDFPKEETYGLVSQMRRSVISIPSNIAEGAARHSKKEFRQFLYIASGSVSELDTQLIICNKLTFINDDSFRLITDELSQIKKMLFGLLNSIKG
jgi:four helix bundle protein